MGGFGTSYGDTERRFAIAIAEHIGVIEGGGGGGGGDASAANQTALNLIAATIRDRIGTNFTPASRSGNSSPTANTWVEVMPAKADRKIWTVQYNPSGLSILELGCGSIGNEVSIAFLTPGSGWFESLPNFVNANRIVVRSAATSQNFIAWEA